MVFKRWQIISGIALLVVCTTASALSLGRVRGTALLGRSLDLSIQSTLDAQEPAPDASCLAAEVFYGDTRVAPSAVSLVPERVSSGELRIRVRASTVVDEPIVTLFVRSSCQGAQISRRYVLLAEVLTEGEQSGSVAALPSLTQPAPLSSPRIAFGGAQPPVSSGASAPSGDTASSNAQARRAERAERRRAQREAQAAAGVDVGPALQAAQRVSRQVSVVRKTAVQETPRLKIDLLDLTASEPSLRGSAELSSAPSSDEAVRSQAQALWRALNASPEDALRDAQRLQALEEQMRSALEQSKRQVQDIAALNSQLQAAQKARYLNPFTVLLGLLTLAALAFGALMWQRSRSVESGQPWWGKRAKRGLEDEQHLWSHLGEAGDSIRAPLQKTADSGFAPSTNSLRASGTSGIAVTSATNEIVGLESKDTSPLEFKLNSGKMALHPGDNGSSISSSSINQQGRFGRVDETTPPSVAVSMPQRAGKIDAKARTSKDSTSGFGQSEFASGAFGGSRLVAAEELFDIQEQADFFLSLGQPDQAIEVLKNHITDNVETSALAYMDLFDIYHRTNRQSDYADLREQFNHVFNAQVPEFARYGLQSNGLEDFPEVLGSIQSVWGQPLSAQDVIEASIFRQPDQAHPILDMTAYRELMLLYALAKELSRPDAGYSAVPMSMQTPVLALGGVLNTPDVDLGDGLVLSSSLDDLLSPEDRTVSLPHPLIKFSDAPNGDGSLDFDLSDSADLGIVKKSGKAPKFSN